MDNVMGVAVGDAGKQLFQEHSCITLAELSSGNNLIKKLASLDVLRDDVEALLVLEVFKDFDDVGVVEASQDIDFVDHCGFLAVVHIFLLQNFDRTLFFSFAVSTKTNLAEGALSEYLSNLVHVTECTLCLLNEHGVRKFDCALIYHLYRVKLLFNYLIPK